MGLYTSRSIALFASACLFGVVAQADIVYTESVSGDLSGSGLSPTPITVALGSNQVFGTTGRAAGVIDLDYFRLTGPVGEVLTSITILPGTAGLGTLGDAFIGVQAGSQVTVLPTASNATGLLGWFHYDNSDVGKNILPLMGTSVSCQPPAERRREGALDLASDSHGTARDHAEFDKILGVPTYTPLST